MDSKNGKPEDGIAVLERPTGSENLITPDNKGTKRYYIKLRGVTPLLTDPMDDETLEVLRTGATKEIDKTRPKEDICETKLYKDDEGNITMPSINVLAAINHAGKLFKYDAKRNLATGTSSLIPSFLMIEGEFLKFSFDEWKPDERRGRLQNGTAVSIVRPKFDVWSTEFYIQLDDNEPIKIDKVIALFQKAGKTSGLGSFRPSCKGQFGQFKVEECIEVDLES